MYSKIISIQYFEHKKHWQIELFGKNYEQKLIFSIQKFFFFSQFIDKFRSKNEEKTKFWLHKEFILFVFILKIYILKDEDDNTSYMYENISEKITQ